jgi:hypothetical protein
MNTPLYYKWVIPIFRPLVTLKPRMDYEALHNVLRPYANDGSITNPILQRGWDAARCEIFGSPEENAWYAEGIVERMRSLGHSAELVFSTHTETMQTINTTGVNEEVIRRKKKTGEPLLDGIAERKEFWTWKEEHAAFLAETLGIEGGPAENKFLTGILITTSVSTNMFQTTQEVVQADGAHTSFGKYTLFSAYTTTANGNMANIAFGILFGNEDTKNWTMFWNFVRKVHPTINRPQVMLMTDQDKGSITLVRVCIPQSFNFHCSYHRRENINKYCGGGTKKGKPLTAMWLFCHLSACSNMQQLKAEEAKYIDQLHPTDWH